MNARLAFRDFFVIEAEEKITNSKRLAVKMMKEYSSAYKQVFDALPTY